MNYYTKELQISDNVQKTAGIKARDDVDEILSSMTFKPILITGPAITPNSFDKAKRHLLVKKNWEQATSQLKDGDVLVVQFPVINHSILLFQLFENLKRRNIKIVLLIHDLEMLRKAKRRDVDFKTKIRLIFEEKQLLQISDTMIVHNEKMKEQLVGMGLDGNKMVCLEIFDYLIPKFDLQNVEKNRSLKLPVVIAGTLRPHKAQYAYKLPESPEFNLYGVGYEKLNQKNVSYFGALPPDDLPMCMKGSFGIVWDGEESKTCTGVYGDYLRINNPHKTSLYIASGLPVIIWKEAALANFVLTNRCGIVVDSLYNIAPTISNMTEDEYRDILFHTYEMSVKLRKGGFLQDAIKKI